MRQEDTDEEVEPPAVSWGPQVAQIISGALSGDLASILTGSFNLVPGTDVQKQTIDGITTTLPTTTTPTTTTVKTTSAPSTTASPPAPVVVTAAPAPAVTQSLVEFEPETSDATETEDVLPSSTAANEDDNDEGADNEEEQNQLGDLASFKSKVLLVI